MIYVPNVEEYQCVVVRSENVIRAYKQVPRQNSTVDYRDFYYNSNYLYNDGIQSFGNYSTSLPICLDNSVLTSDFYYRNDLDSILIIFLVFAIFSVYIPIKIFSKLFKKGSL